MYYKAICDKKNSIRKLGTFLGDCFFYGVVTVFIITSLAIAMTPVKDFLYRDIISQFDYRGKEEAILAFQKKLFLVGLSTDSFRPQIMIRKRMRELLVISDDLVVASYPIGLSRVSHGIKLNRSDQKTPEGQYFVCAKNENHKYYLFMQINYPSPDDAKRGSVQGIIRPTEEAAIEKSWTKKKPPPENTELGGPIGIHGFGAETAWTKDGSIALHNQHMEELYWNLPIGTPIVIIP